MTRILLVEDSPTQAAELVRALGAEGFEVETAPDGVAGLATATAGGFDLVVSDVVMPGLTGYELCRALKAHAVTRALPVVLLTSLGDPLDVMRALECGSDGFITKPCEATHLAARIRAVLANRAVRAEAAPGEPAEVVFQGQRFAVRAERDQVLDLLMGTFEDVVRTNHELRSRQAELLRVQRQKEELSALVVHDLKSPLSGIFLLLRVLQRSRALSGEDRESLELIEAACESMQRMVMNLLDISRAEDGRLAPRFVPVDLAAVVEHVRGEMARRAAHGQQTVLATVTLRERVLPSDRDLIQRVLENLVDNGLRYTPRGGTLRVEAVDVGDAVEVRVRDEGPGVPPAFRERIFEKYVQIEAPREGGRTTRGLGLVFCRLAVEALGGSIRVEPNEPRGSCFVVRLARR